MGISPNQKLKYHHEEESNHKQQAQILSRPMVLNKVNRPCKTGQQYIKSKEIIHIDSQAIFQETWKRQQYYIEGFLEQLVNCLKKARNRTILYIYKTFGTQQLGRVFRTETILLFF